MLVGEFENILDLKINILLQMVSCLQFLHFSSSLKLHKNAHALYLLVYYCDLPNLFNPP
jgi:hypothetical protein